MFVFKYCRYLYFLGVLGYYGKFFFNLRKILRILIPINLILQKIDPFVMYGNISVPYNYFKHIFQTFTIN
jgi:hypothetical protein